MQGLRSLAMTMNIRNLEVDYGLEPRDIENMTDEELMEYIDFLEELKQK